MLSFQLKGSVVSTASHGLEAAKLLMYTESNQGNLKGLTMAECVWSAEMVMQAGHNLVSSLRAGMGNVLGLRCTCSAVQRAALIHSWLMSHVEMPFSWELEGLTPSISVH